MADSPDAMPASSPVAPKPPHIPDALVYDFDMYQDPAYLADPHERILDLHRTAPPIFWTPRHGGYWMMLSHEANYKASRDTEAFTSEVMPAEVRERLQAAMPPGSPRIPHSVPISLDPPEHGKYRAPLQAAFSPKRMMALQDGIRAFAAGLIEEIKPLGRSNIVTDVAEPLPVQVFLKLFGLPVERQKEYRALVKEHFSSIELNNPMATMGRILKVTAIMRDTLLERKANPQDDMISMLWQTRIDDKEMTLDTMEDYCVVLFLAGLDTVMNAIGLAVRHLARDVDLQRRLRAEPKFIPEASEEMLRRYTFTVPPRRVARDVVFEGVAMKAGETVLLYLPGADLDGREFEHPERYDLERGNNVHIAFGVGPHRCLGSHLARIELQILYEELLARLPEFRIDPENPPRFHGGHVVGPEHLWIVWDM
jgi:cytochrome P450